MRNQPMPMLNLERNPNQQPFYVSMESFFEFSFWLAEELQDLVEDTRWQEKCKKAIHPRLSRLEMDQNVNRSMEIDSRSDARNE